MINLQGRLFYNRGKTRDILQVEHNSMFIKKTIILETEVPPRSPKSLFLFELLKSLLFNWSLETFF